MTAAGHAVRRSGFTLVRNATLLDFPLEPSLRSLLPAVDELVVNVGASDDDTLDRVRALDDPRLRIIERVWDRTLGPRMLAVETAAAMAACRGRWGFYLQADEVLADGAAARLVAASARADTDPRVLGVVATYRHFYGAFDVLATNRKWYRREVRAIRLDADVHPYRDAQGFRVGPQDARVPSIMSDAVIFHYGWAQPRGAKRDHDRTEKGEKGDLPWIPGLRRYEGPHPRVAEEWIAARAGRRAIAPRRLYGKAIRLLAADALERLTGWRPFEYRGYTLVR